MKKKVDYVTVLVGLLLFVGGLLLLRFIAEPEGIMLPLPFICIGLGSGAFGHGMGNIIGRRTLKKNPELAKRVSVEEKDERNVAIGNLAKAKAYDRMVFVFGALMISFSLMGVNLTVILLLIAAYLFVVGCNIFYRVKYDKEM